jgi:hypothetical protein
MGDSNNNLYSRSSAGKNAKADGKNSGYNIDPGPYEAIVQGHVQGTRMGQLIVTIPDWSGVVNPGTGADGSGSNSDQIVVSYASPFYGSTYGTDTQQLPDSPATSGQSYGMWMVPPDLGCKVLVTFVAGDLSRGYWFACVYDTPSHHMVPGIARDIGGASNTKDPGDSIDQYLSSDSVLPVIEYNTASSTAFTGDGLTSTPRNPHEIQTMTLVSQGLDRDPIRGAISSSSLRESPSNVYGISTPGRKATPGDQVDGQPQTVIYRKGGHQFVMDDGAAAGGQDPEGTDQLIRLRSSGGHQILMNDTEKVLYIASATGAQWMEFSPDGSINVYGAAGFNMRTEGPMNFHSDTAINFCTPSFNVDAIPSTKGFSLPSISLKSDGDFTATAVMKASISGDAYASLSAIGKVSIDAGAAMSVGAIGALSISSGATTKISGVGAVSIDGTLLNLNCAGPTPPTPGIPSLPPIPKALPDSIFTGTSWSPSGVVLSTLKVVPTHEPWTRPVPVTAT